MAPAVLLALAAITPAAHAGSEISGVLETAAPPSPYSRIYGYSEGSSEPVDYIFRNDSAVGRRILAGCVPDLFCKAQVTQERPAQSPPGFKGGGSDTVEILQVTYPRIDTRQDRIGGDTRFGPVDIREERLYWRKNPILPEIKGEMRLLRHYEIGDKVTGSDVLVLQTTDNSACQVMLRLLVVSAKGVTSTERFGTCTNLYRTVQNYDSPVITIYMVGYQGRLDPANPQSGSLRNRETYQFKNGVLSKLASK